jgi:hypothetical protein
VSEDLNGVRALWDGFENGEVSFEVFDERTEWHTASDLADKEVRVGSIEIGRMLARIRPPSRR